MYQQLCRIAGLPTAKKKHVSGSKQYTRSSERAKKNCSRSQSMRLRRVEGQKHNEIKSAGPSEIKRILELFQILTKYIRESKFNFLFRSEGYGQPGPQGSSRSARRSRRPAPERAKKNCSQSQKPLAKDSTLCAAHSIRKLQVSRTRRINTATPSTQWGLCTKI